MLYNIYYSDLQVIRLLQRQVMASEETLCIDVRREYLLTDALCEARKKKFDPRKPIKVLIILCPLICIT